MAEQVTKGLALAEQYYTDYGRRVKDLRASGKKVIGYVSALAPVEILTAAGVVPVRLKGNVSEAITKADAHMETIVCPFVRNIFDGALKGRYDYLDGMVFPHQCDSIDRTNDVWRYNLKLPYWHFLNVPHVTDDPSLAFFEEVLRLFMTSLESFTGTRITRAALEEAIHAHNENRRLMRELYALRKADPPLITGAEMMKVMVAAMGLPCKESSQLVGAVKDEVTRRAGRFEARPARIMLMGDQIDDAAIVEAVEKRGAWLVMDDLSTGSKMYWNDVDETQDPVAAIAQRYLRKLRIPTTFINTGETYAEILEARFGHLKRYIEEFRVNGVILFLYKYCDPYGFEVPAVKSFIESAGIPVLHVEDEYSTSTLARLKTRIEAFLEMIS